MDVACEWCTYLGVCTRFKSYNSWETLCGIFDFFSFFQSFLCQLVFYRLGDATSAQVEPSRLNMSMFLFCDNMFSQHLFTSVYIQVSAWKVTENQ